MEYLLIFSVLIISGAIIYFLYNKFKIPVDKKEDAMQKREKSTGEDLGGEYKALDDDQKNEILDFKDKCKNYGLNVSVKNIVKYSKRNNDLDRLFNMLLICQSSEYDLNFDNLIKVFDEGLDIEEFVEVYIDLSNSGVNVPIASYLIHLKKGNKGRAFADILIKSKKSNIDLVCNDLIKYGLTDAEGEKILFALIRAKKANIYITDAERLKLNLTIEKDYMLSYRISKNLLFELHRANKNIDRIVNAMIRSHESDVQLNLEALDIYTLNDDDFEALVNNLIKAKRAGVYIEQEDLLHQNVSGNAISKLVNATISARKNDLGIEFSEIMEYHLLTGGDVLNYISALALVKSNKMDIPKEYFVGMTSPKNDLVDLVNALKFISQFPDAGFTKGDIEGHFKKKGKVIGLIKTVFNAKAEGINLSFGLASEIECSDAHNLHQILAMTVEPLVLEVEPAQTIITKDGIQVTPKIFVTWKARIDKIFGGFKEDVTFPRINEALIHEIENYKNHVEVLENLTNISKKVLKKLKGLIEIPEHATEKEIEEINAKNLKEAEIDENSAYEILEITIYDLIIGKDIKTELKLEEEKTIAHIHELHAHAHMLQAEVDLRQAMIDAYKSGDIPNFNELHKDTLLKDKKEGGH